MKQAMIFAFKKADAAAERAHQLKTQGFDVIVSGPLDLIISTTTSPGIGAWPDVEGQWYMVVASQQPLTAA